MERKNRGTEPREGKGPIRALLMIALFLALLIVVQIGVIYTRSRRASNDAEALLSAIRMEQAEHGRTPMPSGAPETPKQPLPGTSAEPVSDGIPAPEETPAAADPDWTPPPEDEPEDDEPDPLADYVQPEAPEVTERREILEKVRAEAGEDAVIGILSIPEIGQELPVIGKWSYSLLKISVCRYSGPEPNGKGNLILLGHNYKNGSHFGRLDELKEGAEIRLEDMDGHARVYTVYDTEKISPTDFRALEKSEGESALTLVTCTNSGNSRLVVRCAMQP